MEKLGAVQLGKETDKTFLKGLIPKEWEEKVYEHDNFWAIKCKRDYKSQSKNWLEKEKEFQTICKNIIGELDEHLMEIYSIESNGNHFVVYLRKNITQ